MFTKTYGKSSGYLYSKIPFEFISSDIFGPINSIHFKTRNQKEYFYLITFTDIFSRLTEAYYLTDITANTVMKALEKWCLEYGFQKNYYPIRDANTSVQISRISSMSMA
ncbi:hypothetical protein DMUE_0466 [Dictyocoela muelleri]|nr:hypothetical protein DMUE_0466 [Dictyocoela muelleri]